MAEYWVRLWQGTTTDPKWQTIARKSGQPRSLVMAFFMHLLMVANEAEERGSIAGLSIEDSASAMDCDEDQIVAILEAMNGRVIEDGRLSGWDNRQPTRNDEGDEKTGAKSAAERKREQREREKAKKEKADVTTSHDESRDFTTSQPPKAEEEAEADTSTSLSPGVREIEPTRKGIVCGLLRSAGMADAAPHYLTDEDWKSILAKRTDEEIVEVARAKMAAMPNQRIGLKYIAKALMDDPQPITANQRGSPRMSHADASKLAAARAIFGTEIEGKQHGQGSEGRVIDITPGAARLVGG